MRFLLSQKIEQNMKSSWRTTASCWISVLNLSIWGGGETTPQPRPVWVVWESQLIWYDWKTVDLDLLVGWLKIENKTIPQMTAFHGDVHPMGSDPKNIAELKKIVTSWIHHQHHQRRLHSHMWPPRRSRQYARMALRNKCQRDAFGLCLYKKHWEFFHLLLSSYLDIDSSFAAGSKQTSSVSWWLPAVSKHGNCHH